MDKYNQKIADIKEPKKSFVVNVIQDIKESIRGDAHTMREVIEGFDRAISENMNIIDIIECHHNYLQESIEVLMDKHADLKDRQTHLGRFLKLFYMHGRAEEETLYHSLLNSTEREARLEGFGGQDEHEIAYQLSDELRDLDYATKWSEEIDAKARVVAALVESHIKEEENEMFSIAEKHISGEEFNSLAAIYIEKCRLYLKPTYNL